MGQVGAHGAQQLRADGTIAAGQEIVLNPQLRDPFGNASSASDGALTASLEGPEGVTVLPCKRLSGLGAYEIHRLE